MIPLGNLLTAAFAFTSQEGKGRLYNDAGYKITHFTSHHHHSNNRRQCQQDHPHIHRPKVTKSWKEYDGKHRTDSHLRTSTSLFIHTTSISPYARPSPFTSLDSYASSSPVSSSSTSSASSSSSDYSSSSSSTCEMKDDKGNNSNNNNNNSNVSLEELCKSLDATPTDLLRLSTSDVDGERGVYLNQSVQRNDVLLRIPISSCIRDDMPPAWYRAWLSDDEDDDDVDDENDNGDTIENKSTSDGNNPNNIAGNHYNPSDWATRLAASLLDLQLRIHRNDQDKKGQTKTQAEHDLPAYDGKQKWYRMMPNPTFLRASLPVHWSEDVLSGASCTALELAVDASYFARAAAVAEIAAAFRHHGDAHFPDVDLDDFDIDAACQNVLDLVQTRSCRVERMDGVQLVPSLRVLAPIFDFINHGSCRCVEGDGCANAYFSLEGGASIHDDVSSFTSSPTKEEGSELVVRASRNMEPNEEILIDYGDSARPAWRCLASYGFVPEYRIHSPDDVDDDDDDQEEDESVAEVYMDGSRYEVGSHTVPFDMVQDARDALLEEMRGGRRSDSMDDHQHDKEDTGTTSTDGNPLTPEVALRIAKRVSDVAFLLLLEPTGNDREEGVSNGEEEDDYDDGEIDGSSPEEIISSRLAASLRWSQHQVLLSCAVGLRDYAARR